MHAHTHARARACRFRQTAQCERPHPLLKETIKGIDTLELGIISEAMGFFFFLMGWGGLF